MAKKRDKQALPEVVVKILNQPGILEEIKDRLDDDIVDQDGKVVQKGSNPRPRKD